MSNSWCSDYWKKCICESKYGVHIFLLVPCEAKLSQGFYQHSQAEENYSSPQVAIFQKFPLNSSWHKLGWFFLGRYIFILHFLAFAIRKFNLDFSSIIKATFDKIPDSCFKLQFRENKYVKKSSIFRFC